MPSLETSFFDRLSKNPDKIGVFAEHIFFMSLLCVTTSVWRPEKDVTSGANSSYFIFLKS